MKRSYLIAAALALVVGAAAVAVTASFVGKATEGESATKATSSPDSMSAPEIDLAQATTGDAVEPKPTSDSNDTEEDKTMTEDTSAATATRTPEEEAAFKQNVHEGDVALGVCGARVSALLWFYEASVAQGRDDLKPAVESLSESRDTIKKEAERRAVDDKIDTSVRVMNSESEKLWDDLNEKAAGDAEEFQKAHDELVTGVQECLNLFFDRPDGADAIDPKKRITAPHAGQLKRKKLPSI